MANFSASEIPAQDPALTVVLSFLAFPYHKRQQTDRFVAVRLLFTLLTHLELCVYCNVVSNSYFECVYKRGFVCDTNATCVECGQIIVNGLAAFFMS